MRLPIRVRLTASYLAPLATVTVAVPVRLSHDRGELELFRRPVGLREEAITVVSRFRELANAKQILLQRQRRVPNISSRVTGCS